MENAEDVDAEELAARRARFLLVSVRFKHQLDKLLPALKEALECKHSDSATTNPLPK